MLPAGGWKLSENPLYSRHDLRIGWQSLCRLRPRFADTVTVARDRLPWRPVSGTGRKSESRQPKACSLQWTVTQRLHLQQIMIHVQRPSHET